MGTCCDAHLTTKVREYIPNAQNGAVTVSIVENPPGYITCDYCKANAEFSVSYYPKSNLDSDH